MTDVEKTIRLYENNRSQLAVAVTNAHGNFDNLLDTPLVDVLRILAQNNIEVIARPGDAK